MKLDTNADGRSHVARLLLAHLGRGAAVSPQSPPTPPTLEKRLYDAEAEVESLTKRLRTADELIRQMREQLVAIDTPVVRFDEFDEVEVESTVSAVEKLTPLLRGPIIGYDHGADLDET